ncbi:MAG TPA: M56 family metallopeptidase [Candidatus Cybelea sp.]|nr:M56 family metallopeptidase [Candidatus Cybelea sp.]
MSADFLARGYFAFVTYLAEPAVRSLGIGCFTAMALAAFRVRGVGARLLLWTALLWAALAMPFLGTFLPRLPFPVPASPLVTRLQASFERRPVPLIRREAATSRAVLHVRVATTQATVKPDAEAYTFPFDRHAWKGAEIGDAKRPVHRSVSDAPSLGAASAPAGAAARFGAFSPSSLPAAPTQRGFAIPWTAVLLGIYLLGVTILFVRLSVGLWLSRRLDRAAQTISDREALRLLYFRSSIAGLSSAPPLKESAMLAVPATVGVRRSAILLPVEWRSWNEDQLNAILAHEVSHVARRDALTQLLSLVHRAIFWFSPLSWWLDKQLTDLAEQASDEAALAGGADRTRYAQTLLGFFAQLGATQRRVWWQGVAMAKRARVGSAERRVDRILAWKGSISMKKSFAVALIALVAPVVFLAASVHPFIAHAQDGPQLPRDIVKPGGPVAPALPNAPKGGVVAPAIPAPPAAPAPGQGVLNPGPMPPAPAAPLNLRHAPAIAGVSAPADMRTPPATTPVSDGLPGPLTRIPSQAPTAPPTPRARITFNRGAVVTGSLTTFPPADSSTPAPAATLASAPMAPPYASAAPLAALAGDSASVQQASSEVRAAQDALARAKKDLEEANSAANKDVEEADAVQVRAAEKALVQAKADLEEAERIQREQFGNTIINGNVTSGSGPRYVMVTENSRNTEMSGTDEDLEHALRLQKKMGGDLIWFERDEKSYIITDPDFIAKVKALFAPEDALGLQENELGRQEDDLGRQQDALGQKMENVKVKIPDITPDLERVRERLRELSSGATQSELGALQSELGRLQSQIGRYQSQAGVQQSAIGRQQSELGHQQAELGRQQAELGRRQSEIARKATQQLRGMFSDAISKGIAKPE